MKHVLDAADGDDGHYEEDGDKAHSALSYKVRDRSAFAAPHGLWSLPRAPSEKARADNKKHTHSKKVKIKGETDDNAFGLLLAKPTSQS